MIVTKIQGSLFNPDGTTVTSGKLYVKLQQDLTSIDGFKVAPFTQTYSIPESGALELSLAATSNTLEGSIFGNPEPTGVVYIMEFDPTPLDQTVPIDRKSGYFKNIIDIPHISDDQDTNTLPLSSLDIIAPAQPLYGEHVVLDNDPRIVSAVVTTTIYDDPDWLGTLAAEKITGVLTLEQGGTGATTSSAARDALNLPTRTGGNASGTWGISITGVAGSVAWNDVTSKPTEFTPTSHTAAKHSDWPVGVDMTEVGYLSGVTSDIQSQINSKSATTHNHDLAYAAIGHGTTSHPDWPAEVSLTELGYLSTVTSDIQTQFSNKQPLDADLTAISALSTTGIVRRTAADTWDTTSILPVSMGGTGTISGDITGTGALTLTAGGTNQNVILTPSGTGKVYTSKNLDVAGTINSTGSVTTANQFVCTLVTGTSPLVVASSTVITNLNADLLDGQHASYFLPLANISGTSGYVGKFTAGSSVGNSVLFESSGKVGLGITTPASDLSINAARPTFGMYSSGAELYKIQEIVSNNTIVPGTVTGDIVVRYSSRVFHYGINGVSFLVGPESFYKWALTLNNNGGISVGHTYHSQTPPVDGLLVQGSVAIGNTNTSSTLGVSGNVAIGASYGSGYAAPANGLIVEGLIGVGVTSPAAQIHIKAGSTTVAPLRLTAGPLLTNPVTGSLEFYNNTLYLTGVFRKAIATANGTGGYLCAFAGDNDISGIPPASGWLQYNGTIYTWSTPPLISHDHSGVYEPVLGNPDTTGKVLSSTSLGVRSWVAQPTVITDHTGLSNIGTNSHSAIDTALSRLASTSGTNTGDSAGHTTLVPYTGASGNLDLGAYKLIGTTQAFIDINRCGFVNRSETSISFDGTNTFTLTDAGSGWSYYRGGIKSTISGNKTATLSGTPPATAATYYIYINDASGTLTTSTTAWTLADQIIPVAIVYWNNSLAPKYQLADERHTCQIDRANHRYEHLTEGAKFISGGALSTLVASSDNAVSKRVTIAEAVIADEDVTHTLAVLTPNATVTTTDYMVYYRTNSTTWAWVASDMPFKYNGSTSFIQYDSSGTMTDGNGGTGGSARWFNSYILFTNISGSARYVVIPGRGSFTSQANAQAENPLLFDFTGFPLNEAVIAWQLTWAINATYTSVGKCVYVAQKKINVGYTGLAVSGVGVDHSTLAGLQGGATSEYYHLTSADYVGTGTGVIARKDAPAFTGAVTTTGTLGIGSASAPARALHITGSAGPVLGRIAYTGSETSASISYMGLEFVSGSTTLGEFTAASLSYPTTGLFSAGGLYFQGWHATAPLALVQRSTGPILFITNGYQADNERLRITSAGLIGINCNAPASTLSVSGGVAIGATYAAGPTVAPTSGMIIEGKVGIGNNSPTYALDVTGAIRCASSASGSPYTQSRVILYSDSGNWAYYSYGADAQLRMVYSKTSSAATMFWGTTTAHADNTGVFTQTMSLTAAGVLTTTGNISTPAQLVSTVATGTAPLSVTSTTAVANLNSDLLDGQHGSYYAVAGAAPTAHDITSHTSWPAGLTATELGFVDGVTSGIQGQIDLKAPLASPTFTGTVVAPTINGGVAANDDITIQGTSDSTRTSSYVLLQPNGGNVGIGTTSPIETLEVRGSSGRFPLVLSASLIDGQNIGLGFRTYVGGSASIKGGIFYDRKAPYGIGDFVFALSSNETGETNVSMSDEKVRITKSGTVGIGTASPASKLSVNGGLAVGTTYAGSNAADNNNIIVQESVGIGTVSPKEALEIYGATKYIGLTTPANNQGTGIRLYTGSTLEWQIGKGFSVATNDFAIRNQVYGTTPFFISQSTSNVGIGTTSPGCLLDLSAAVGQKINLYQGSVVGFGVQSNLFEFIGPHASLDYTFGYGTSGSLTRLLTIKGSGKVGIGTTAPASTLSVYGGLGVGTTVAGATTSTDGNITLSGGIIGTESLTISSGGSGNIILDPADGQYVICGHSVGVGANPPVLTSGVGIHIGGKFIRLDTTHTPASNAAGNAGEICWDGSYLYVCTATGSPNGTWKRVALTGGY